jgi:type II secretion system protein G
MSVARGQRSGDTDQARSCRAHGFTLIELLVVVAIIGILVGIMLPAIGGVKIKAQIKKAESEVKSLASACRAYHVEYGYWPANPSSGGLWAENNYEVIRDLLAANSSGRNPRGINFIESTNTTTAWGDPFRSNMPYRISISVVGNSVRVWSCGPNGVDENGDFDSKAIPPRDDIEVTN